MAHFEALYDIFVITVRELIKNDVARLAMPSQEAEGQQVIKSGHALKEKIDLISHNEWEKIHGVRR